MSLMSCTECRKRLPEQAEACPECGYPVMPRSQRNDVDDSETTQTALKEYKLMQLSGVAVCGAGIVAALADSPIGAAVAITVGIATYITGLLGVWWNTGD